MTSLSRVSIWRRERRDEFPKRVRLGRNSVAWDLGEVEAWIGDQLARRNGVEAGNDA
jgi:predicted DNA-binding transcriptional regulator AlpA